jgi:hypothetical protein
MPTARLRRAEHTGAKTIVPRAARLVARLFYRLFTAMDSTALKAQFCVCRVLGTGDEYGAARGMRNRS